MPGNPFIDLPRPEGHGKIRHPREPRIFIETQMQSGPPARWAFIAHTGISLFVPGCFDSRDEAITACDVKLVPRYASEVRLMIERVLREKGQIGEAEIRAYTVKRWPELTDLHTQIIEAAAAASVVG